MPLCIVGGKPPAVPRTVYRQWRENALTGHQVLRLCHVALSIWQHIFLILGVRLNCGGGGMVSRNTSETILDLAGRTISFLRTHKAGATRIHCTAFDCHGESNLLKVVSTAHCIPYFPAGSLFRQICEESVRRPEWRRRTF